MTEFLHCKGPIDIAGHLLPCELNDEPFLVQLPGEPAKFVIVFSDVEKLREQMRFLAPDMEYKIKHIDDQQEFCESIWEHGLRIMSDPSADPQTGTTRWVEVMSKSDYRIIGRN